jgi:hypothetical protein
VVQVLGLTKTFAMRPHDKSLQPTPLRVGEIGSDLRSALTLSDISVIFKNDPITRFSCFKMLEGFIGFRHIQTLGNKGDVVW